MTHSGGKPHNVGDRGQRYEVSYRDDDDGQRKVIGWSDDIEGAQSLCRSIRLWPGKSHPAIRDRENGQ